MGDTTRAVVLGGSIAGLLAARVLSDAYDDVLIVDRDVLVGVREPRRGAPQGRHISGLLTGGQRALEQLYPGITQELFDDTVPYGDLAKDVRWYMQGYRLQPHDAKILTTGPSRPLLERHIRERTEVIPNVRFMERTDILGLEATPARSSLRPTSSWTPPAVARARRCGWRTSATPGCPRCARRSAWVT